MIESILPLPLTMAGNHLELKAFVARLDERTRRYLNERSDRQDQIDHLRHVADRSRWLYYSELQRQYPAYSVTIPYFENFIIDACTLSHDMGKWIPREVLRALMPDTQASLEALFRELHFSADQSELFLLGVRRRFSLPHDGYIPEYDAAHHLVSAFILTTDTDLGFHQLTAEEQQRLNAMIIGHQFGSYFKASLLDLSLRDREVTTGMLVDTARPERISDDLLASVFHDADISDLLFVGSLERRPNREEAFHTGGLVKILLINFANLLFEAPQAPHNLEDCLHSCAATVHNVCKELLTPTAIEYGALWRKQARHFLDLLREKSVSERLNTALLNPEQSAQERLGAVRLLTYMHARNFLKSAGEAL